MDKDFFNELQSKYSIIISNIIDNNYRFYRMNKKIKWSFGYDERVALMGCFNRTTDSITINICSVDFAFNRNEPLQIECFLLHEIRHMFQHSEILNYKQGLITCVDAEIIGRWADEEKHYVAAINENDKVNAEYYSQDMEFDAFAFSFAVMKYKYGNVPYLVPPKSFGEKFYDTINKWCEMFKRDNL